MGFWYDMVHPKRHYRDADGRWWGPARSRWRVLRGYLRAWWLAVTGRLLTVRLSVQGHEPMAFDVTKDLSLRWDEEENTVFLCGFDTLEVRFEPPGSGGAVRTLERRKR